MSETVPHVTSTEPRRAIRDFILATYMRGSAPDELADDDLLFESGIIDSTGAISLILFLEERFGITVADSELFPANFASIDRIDGFIQHKTTKANGRGAQ